MRTILDGVRPGRLTVVIMMGLKRREEIVASLVGRGWTPGTPAAIVSGAGTARQQVWTGTLSDLPTAATSRLPGVIVVGEVVNLRAIVGFTKAVVSESAVSGATAIDGFRR
jgi:siroheme synthase